MNIKSLFGFCILTLSSSICVAQVPAKKTNLTTTDREVWRKARRWPDEFESNGNVVESTSSQIKADWFFTALDKTSTS